MSAAIFGITRNPFERDLELDDACLPNAIAKLVSELQSTMRAPRGVGVFVAPASSGKSIAAVSLARRLEAVARVAWIDDPTSSVSAIARDAVGQLNEDDGAFSLDEEWCDVLRADVERHSANGQRTVIIIDDAHRLSPQTLEDLATLFDEQAPPRLHLFLFGRPRLVDRIHAGAEHALEAHLLQVCRAEPLSVRESVRYLERRIALCGGELSGLCSADAIECMVSLAEGRLVKLEEIARQAFECAAARGKTRISAEDVTAAEAQPSAEEEEVMAGHQQPLRFSLTDTDDTADDWRDEDAGDDGEKWSDELEEEEEEWQADDEEEAPSSRKGWLSWGHEAADETRRETPEPAARRTKAPSPDRRFFGPAVLSVAVCFALVWAANHLPGPREQAPRGRDSLMTPKPLSSQPQQIMRLASTPEAADADAQVMLWRSQPPRATAHDASAAPSATTASTATPAKDPEPATPAKADATPNAADASAKATTKAVENAAVTADTKLGRSQADAEVTMLPSAKTAGAKSAPAAVAKVSTGPVAKKGGAEVYTVQLGAFKTRTNAEQLVGKLGGRQKTRILRENGLYRVLSGSFASRKDAAMHEASLKRAGYTAFVRTAMF